MSKFVSHGRALVGAVLCVALGACQTTSGMRTSMSMEHLQQEDEGSFCSRRPIVCVVVGAVVVGGVVAVVASGGDSDDSVPDGGSVVVSDMRLKEDVRLVEQLENGIKLYAYRYVGDDRIFVGVNATEIQADSRFAAAIRDTGKGYLAVDYRALGLQVVNEREMQAAGAGALARAPEI
jgi:hypothetical protein